MIWLLPWDEDAQVRHMPWATYSLIVLNVLAFLAMLMSTPTELQNWGFRFGLTPSDPHWWQYLTSDFVHGGWTHLIGNMLFLIVFGDNVEDVFGPVAFLLLYLVGGLAGDLMFVHANPTMTIPSFGASGCISAIAGAYGVMFFGSRVGVRLMFLVFTVKTFYFRAFWVLLFWFGADVAQTFSSHGVMSNEPGVNYVAHGAGFAFGVFFGVIALLVGAMHRYDILADGHAWLGYWPPGLESPRRRRPATGRVQREHR
jgi:membrane associated rhomboid family serine protease